VINPLAIGLAALLLAIAGLHFSWAFGFRWPGTDELSLADKVLGARPGSPMPSTGLTIFVSLAIAAGAAVIVAFSAEVLDGPWRPLVATAYLMLTGVFLVRGLVGFVPAVWRRAEGTAFHRLNQLYYSPLCLLIAAGLAVNFALG